MSFKKKTILILMMLACCLLIFGSAALAGQVSSDVRPADISIQAAEPPAHQPGAQMGGAEGPWISPIIPDLVSMVGSGIDYNLHPHENGGSGGVAPSILIVSDGDSWGTGFQNRAVLNDLGLGYDEIISDQLADTNLYNYTHLLVPSDQGQSFYNNLDANMSRITDWVNAGGSFQFNACDEGWAYGYWVNGPGGITHTHPVYSQQNYILAPDHPILQGQTDSDFSYWNYVSHGYFDPASLPAGTQILLANDYAGTQPTLIDFKIGAGHVVASQNTLEWANAGSMGNPANYLILDKIILYMFGAGFDTLQWSASNYDTSLMDVTINPDTDVMHITPLNGAGASEILYTVTDTGTGTTAQQWAKVTFQEQDTTPPALIVNWPEGCLPDAGYYTLTGQVEHGAEIVLVNQQSVQYWNFDQYWAYWRVDLRLDQGENPVLVTAYDQALNEAVVEGSICVGVPQTNLFIQAPDDCIPFGGEFTATVNIRAAENLYGGDVTVCFDRYYLEADNVQVNTDCVFSVGDSTIDNSNGIVSFHASRLYDQYGYDGFYGDAALAWITFRTKMPTREGTCIGFSSWELVGNEGQEGSSLYDIPVDDSWGDCVCIEGSTFTGSVIPEAMPLWQYPYYYDFTGTVVSIEGTAIQTTTDSYGNFMFLNPPTGYFYIVATRPGYLTRAQEVYFDGSNNPEINILLLTGDITQDNVIDIDDLSIMRGDYGYWWYQRSDLDFSGWVGIRDLVFLGRNYSKAGYGFWAVDE